MVSPSSESKNPPPARVVVMDLVRAIDGLLERADLAGWPEAERVAEALGWRDPIEMPDGNWVRRRLLLLLTGDHWTGDVR
jgi:hypothetical protein